MKKTLFTILFSFSSLCFSNHIGSDVNQFALALYSHLDQGEENLAFSPYGIFTNLSLLYFGSADQTADQLKSALHLSATGEKFLTALQKHKMGLTAPSDFGHQLLISNALFAHQGTTYVPRFKQIASDIYGAKLAQVDYERPDSALETINDWISQSTKGKIKEMVQSDDINRSTRLIVANAIYFEGEWVFPFTKKKGTFQLPYEQTKNVDMLHLTQSLPYYETDQLQVLALPFMRNGIKQPFIECMVILPKKEEYKKVEAALSAETIDQILYKLEPQTVRAQIPAFCFSKRIELNEALEKLGITDAFNYSADFSRIDGMKDLYLSKVLHETYFSFHEKGVTAAGATTSHAGVTSAPPIDQSPIEFTADHPFIFCIVDYHSRALLFMGRLLNPTTEGCDEN